MHIRVEAGRMCAVKFFQESLLVAAVPDVFANVIGVGERQDDQIMSLAVAERTRTGCLGLFVFGFAVNNGSSRFARVFTDALPDAHHIAASGIDNLAATVLDLLLDRQFCSERRHNDNVFRSEIGNIGLLVFARKIFYT